MRQIAIGIIFIVLSASNSLAQQWTSSGTNIYNSNTGNVGVGTTAPSQLFEVSKQSSGGIGGTIQITNNITNAVGNAVELRFAPTEASMIRYASIRGIAADVNNNIHLAFVTGAGSLITEKMRITSGGNVGIGTNNPSALLQLSGGGSNTNLLLKTNTAATGDKATIQFIMTDVGGAVANGAAIEVERMGINSASDMYFKTSLSGTALERMRITSSGNLGVGTTSPTERLSVGKSLSTGYTPIMSLNELSNNGNNSMGIDFKFAGASGFPWGATGRLEVARQGTSSNFDMVFHTATNGVLSEKMRILNNGNVGIGNATPNANAKLDVNGNIFTSGKMAIGVTDMTKINPYSLAVNGTAIFTKAIVKSTSSWPDYVFTSTYQLPKLETLEQFIKLNGHLPEVPKAEDIEKKGIDLGSNQALLLKKIEELTLFAIEQNKQSEKLIKTIEAQDFKISTQAEKIKDLEDILVKMGERLKSKKK